MGMMYGGSVDHDSDDGNDPDDCGGRVSDNNAWTRFSSNVQVRCWASISADER